MSVFGTSDSKWDERRRVTHCPTKWWAFLFCLRAAATPFLRTPTIQQLRTNADDVVRCLVENDDDSQLLQTNIFDLELFWEFEGKELNFGKNSYT